MRLPHLTTLLQLTSFRCANRPPSYLLSLASIRQVMSNLHPTICNPTIEHCVPRSYYHRNDHQNLARDMHALLCLPGGLNSHRSNFKLVEPEKTSGWEAVGQGGHAFKHEKRRLFVPPTKYRGPYARSIGYFVLTYPTYASLVHSRVLDLRVLADWSEVYPITHSEQVVHATIESIQENCNPFFVDAWEAQQAVLELLDIALDTP